MHIFKLMREWYRLEEECVCGCPPGDCLLMAPLIRAIDLALTLESASNFCQYLKKRIGIIVETHYNLHLGRLGYQILRPPKIIWKLIPVHITP